MSVTKLDYEESLAAYSNDLGAIALLKQYRPYLELIPSMRRPKESLITIPLPVVRVRNLVSKEGRSEGVRSRTEAIALPCDLALVMCDPEWKIKMGVEIVIFIHRPEEDFSDLLSRWRQTQVLLAKEYEWLMPLRYQHILSEGTDRLYPLFIIFPETPDRIKRGLTGASVPFVLQASMSCVEEEAESTLSQKTPPR